MEQSPGPDNERNTFALEFHPIDACLGQIRTLIAQEAQGAAQFNVTEPGAAFGKHAFHCRDLSGHQFGQSTRRNIFYLNIAKHQQYPDRHAAGHGLRSHAAQSGLVASDVDQIRRSQQRRGRARIRIPAQIAVEQDLHAKSS